MRERGVFKVRTALILFLYKLMKHIFVIFYALEHNDIERHKKFNNDHDSVFKYMSIAGKTGRDSERKREKQNRFVGTTGK